MTIYDIILFFVIAFVAYAIWQHNNISMIARRAAKKHCDTAEVQLLDQNVLLKKLRIARSPQTLFAIKRHYEFEFSTVGDKRYKGSITLLANRVAHIELEPFKL